MRDDRASATLAAGIIGMLFLCLCMGLAIDTAKNGYLKDSLSSRAQHSSEIAAKNIDSRGSLTPHAAYSFVEQYTDGVGKKDESKTWTGICTHRKVANWQGIKKDHAMPYIVITYDTKRRTGNNSSVVYVSEGGKDPVLVKGHYSPRRKYKVLDAEVHDSSSNLMMSMFGKDCQDYDNHVSAISFGSREDLK